MRELNDRVKTLLGYENDPITSTSGGTWKADGVAGLLRLNSRVELEVVPKFLDPSTNGWHTDFFLLAVLVRTGHLLIHDEVSAGTQDRGDLATLIARSSRNLHSEDERRPIRSYRRRPAPTSRSTATANGRPFSCLTQMGSRCLDSN